MTDTNETEIRDNHRTAYEIDKTRTLDWAKVSGNHNVKYPDYRFPEVLGINSLVDFIISFYPKVKKVFKTKKSLKTYLIENLEVADNGLMAVNCLESTIKYHSHYMMTKKIKFDKYSVQEAIEILN